MKLVHFGPAEMAQARPPVYVVNEIEVKDPAAFKRYADAQSELKAARDQASIFHAFAVEGLPN